ncbi:hypothetical protein CN327_29100 [Bacillus cereus]|nr:hypothetical protein CON53_30915 [Bacillus cereus]PES69993.1 hypothetical protein CN509_28545 [Bacillus cereus]PET08519.1 hypothetical protein CN505_04725 [Bacillus cereus]PFF27616.1 hypothetical protein CN327_29100 [Bacillus cereus]PFH93571.1 hypothetical protein COI81_01775 [Bacillus cereus]
MIRILFFYIKFLQTKKDKIGEYDLIFSVREKQVTETSLFFIVLYFLLIFDIKTIYNMYIYIEKFITNLVVNVFKNECKFLAKSLHSFPLKH